MVIRFPTTTTPSAPKKIAAPRGRRRQQQNLEPRKLFVYPANERSSPLVERQRLDGGSITLDEFDARSGVIHATICVPTDIPVQHDGDLLPSRLMIKYDENSGVVGGGRASNINWFNILERRLVGNHTYKVVVSLLSWTNTIALWIREDKQMMISVILEASRGQDSVQVEIINREPYHFSTLSSATIRAVGAAAREFRVSASASI